MKKIISILLCLAVLLGLSGCGGTRPDEETAPSRPTQAQSVGTAPTAEPSRPDAEQATEEAFLNADEEPDETQNFSDYEEDRYGLPAVHGGQQKPVEPGSITIRPDAESTCYLTIECATILNHMDQLTEGKEGLVPADGVILPRTEVVFYEGESVYDVLARETRERRIHMEASFTPGYNSAYIEGIHNLYEFDCGAESGWMYSVNGWFPNYGVSRYVLKQGDELMLRYTCDLGRDVGDQYWDAFQ